MNFDVIVEMNSFRDDLTDVPAIRKAMVLGVLELMLVLGTNLAGCLVFGASGVIPDQCFVSKI